MFYICWRSKITGETGQGTALFDEMIAQAIIDEANTKYPELEHWFETAVVSLIRR